MKTIILTLALILSGCASSLPVKKQAYASLSNQRAFEYEFPIVWKAVGKATEGLKIADRDENKLETDWIYSQSRDKYVEYKVNGSPRRKQLQSRFRYLIEANKQIGATEVKVHVDEEIERLKADGSPNGYETSSTVDPSRASELLDKIGLALISSSN